MDKSHHPNVIRTWAVERTRHPVRNTPMSKPVDKRRDAGRPVTPVNRPDNKKS